MTDFAFDQMNTRARSDEGVWMTIKTLDRREDLTGPDGRALQLLIHGPDSARYRDAMRKAVRERLVEEGGKEPTDEELRTINAAFMASVVSDWRMMGVGDKADLGGGPMLDKEGGAVPYSIETATAFFLIYDDIYDQVDAFVARRANFSLASSGN